ncbi:MAG: hypothetical protein EHM47_09705, partial [Ignavibacteriales bacterium]
MKFCNVPFLIAFLFFSNALMASEILTAEDYQFRHFTIKEGLSQSAVLCIMQDKRGYMWFGTANGLNRFDGYNFISYVNNPYDSSSISDNEITSVFEDGNGYLWIGTVKGVLNKFNRRTETFEYFTPDDESVNKELFNDTNYPISFVRYNSNTITSIAEDKNGNLWIGTWGNGVYRFDKTKQIFDHYYHQSNDKSSLSYNRITKILVDKKSAVWIGTFGGGLNRVIKVQNKKIISGYTFKFIHYKTGEKNSISNNDIVSIYEDSQSNLWIGTFNGGLNMLNNSQKFVEVEDAKFIKYYSNDSPIKIHYKTIMSIVEGTQGDIWLGTLGDGLIKFNPITNSTLNFKHNPLDNNTLPDNDVIALEKDKSGILWLGTSLGRGITQLQINRKKFNHVTHYPGDSNSLSDNVVWSITEDKDGYIWLGTYRGGLNRYDKEKKKFLTYKHNPDDPNSIPDNHIRSLAVDNYNNLWVGCYKGGLSMYNRKTGDFIDFKELGLDEKALGSDQILDIHIENDSVFWLAAYGGGLTKVIFGKNNQVRYKKFVNNPEDNTSLSDNRVYTILETEPDILWVGTFGGGLNKFDKKTGKFKNYKNKSDNQFSLSDNRVTCVFEDSEGILWIGTFGGGLNKYSEELSRFIRYGEKEGLASYIVYGIVEDRHRNLWMSTNNGIFKFTREDNLFTQYDLSDGVQSLEFSGGAYYEASDGEIYFGGINGINNFYPDSINFISYVPDIVISSVKVLNNAWLGERNKMVLSYTENFFLFEFASLDYSNPEDCRYAYMLEGFDEDWRYTNSKQRIAMYTNIAPGEYIFKVIGSNSDGVWNYEGASISLTILPPFWRTWWFIVGMVFLVLTAIYLISTVRIRNLLAIEKLKMKLAADLHDNIGSGLTEISILSELASRQMNNGSRVSNTQNLKSISETSRKLVDNMSDIVWVVNPNKDSLHDLILRLKDSYSEVLTYMGISLKTTNIHQLENIKLPMEYRQNLYLIFKEGLNNCIKHSNCKNIFLNI